MTPLCTVCYRHINEHTTKQNKECYRKYLNGSPPPHFEGYIPNN